MNDLNVRRQHFAEGVCAGLVNESRLTDAFSSIDRAACLLPPPWSVVTQKVGRSRPCRQTSNECDLYHDMLVELNPSKRINNGQPSLWAAVFDRLLSHDLHALLHLGCGSGYYTSIMAALFPQATLRFFDVDGPLQRHATQLFEGSPRVTPDDQRSDADGIVCSFGRSVLPADLLLRWRDGGTILTPVTDRQGRGVFVELVRTGDTATVRPLFYCRFILDSEQHSWPERVSWCEPFTVALPAYGALDLGRLFAPRTAGSLTVLRRLTPRWWR